MQQLMTSERDFVKREIDRGYKSGRADNTRSSLVAAAMNEKPVSRDALCLACLRKARLGEDVLKKRWVRCAVIKPAVLPWLARI